MSTFSLSPLSAGIAFSGGFDGVSKDAAIVGSWLTTIREQFIRSANGQRLIGEPSADLRAIFQSCVDVDWDGQGASPIRHGALLEAERLLEMIPERFPAPDISPEPTGSIAFEWYKGPGRVFVVSVNGSGSVQFAGIFGNGNEDHGKRNFAYLLPPVIVERLSQLFPVA